jgi:endonuclease G
VPLDFWKVVAMIEDDSGELLASAYLLSQEGMMPTEGFRFGAFKTYQVPLSRVAALADIDFGRQLDAADVFAAADVQEAVELGRFAEIDGPDDLILTRMGALAPRSPAPRLPGSRIAGSRTRAARSPAVRRSNARTAKR